MANDETTSEQEETTAQEEEQQVDQDVKEGLEGVADAASGVESATQGAVPSDSEHDEDMEDSDEADEAPVRTIDFIMEVPLAVTVEVGRARMTIQDLLQLGQGSVVELEKLAGDPLDIFINGQKVAKGEAVIVNEKFGIRITEIISPEDRLEQLR